MTPEILVLFDIDGTLLRAAGSGRAATELAMREVFGTVGNLADYRFSGKTDWFTLLHLLTPEGFTEAQIETAMPAFHTALARHMADIMGNFQIHPLPGTLELVRILRDHPQVLLGVLTGNVAQLADIKLRAAGFVPEDFCVAAYGSESPYRRALVPLAMERAARFCGTSFAPNNVVIIGDTPDDIDCAHNVGARVIAVTTGTIAREELEQHQPITVLDSLADHSHVLSLILGTA